MGWIQAHPAQKPELPQGRLHVGDVLADFSLTILGGKADREYLGIADGETHMSLASIDARFVVVQFFNCLCAECQHDLAEMDSLRAALEMEAWQAEHAEQVSQVSLASQAKQVHMAGTSAPAGTSTQTGGAGRADRMQGEPSVSSVIVPDGMGDGDVSNNSKGASANVESSEKAEGREQVSQHFVRFIGIAVHDEARRVAAFRKREGVGFPLFVDRSNTLLERFGIVAPPAACLLERTEQGAVIRSIASGSQEERTRFIKALREQLH